VGPAVLISVELFDPASIVASTAAGARLGFEILWAAFYSGLALIVVQEISARVGVVTGGTLAENIRRRYGRSYALLLFFPSLFLDLSTLTAEVIGLSMALSFLLNVPYVLSVALSILLANVLANLGSYSRLEKVIMLLVTGIFLAYVYFVLELNIPLSGLVMNSIVPTFDPKSFYYAEAIIGASIMPTYVLLHSGLVYEKGWAHHHHKGIEDLIEKEQKAVKNERIDSIFSLLMGTALNIVIIACAAFLTGGEEIKTFLDVASPFSARLGDVGLVLFSLAFGFAGVSAVMTVGLSSVYNSLGFLGIEERMNKRGFRLAFFLWSAVAGIASLLPDGVGIMVFTQYLNGALLLLVIVPLVLIARDNSVMGPHRIGIVTTLLALAVAAVTTLLFVSSLIL
ncbi:MAG TPA: Nramp family divalent metal transporter, partial [Thermoproteota archaeon]|nr:Nramp family divalent metal transporter [Thermoproteota archaeon]